MGTSALFSTLISDLLYLFLVCNFIPTSVMVTSGFFQNIFKAFYIYFWFAILYLHLLWLLLFFSNWISGVLCLRPVG